MTNKPPNGLKLLFADDEQSLQELMKLELPRMGHEVTVCPDGTTALAALQRNSYDCALLDLDMPGASGVEVLKYLKAEAPDTEAIILTGKKSLESAIAAVKLGAFDYLTKPTKLLDLRALLERVAQKRELTRRYQALKRQLERLEGTPRLVGESAPMQAVKRLISKVGPTEATVLIRGETGTGKELAARAIHEQSLRADQPYVAINCGALPENLIESELFGHRKGAFTGADANRDGLFEVANGGTLFLDEIGELPKAVQSKLLRFLESGEVRRVGDNENFTVDVRVVCATHRDLEDMVRQEEFREDLLFRINTFEIYLPSLRERTGDLEPLARHLLSRFRPQLRAEDQAFSPEALAALKAYPWPGNVRELANVIEHAAILCDELPIQPDHLPSKRFDPQRIVTTHSSGPAGPHFTLAKPQTLREIELQVIQQVLTKHDGNKPKAAEELGISLKTMYNKLKEIQAATD